MPGPNPAGLVIGTIAVAALLDAESARAQTYGSTVAGVLIALLLYWLAHTYAAHAGTRLRDSEPLRVRELGHAALEELTIIAGGLAPLAALLIAWAAGARLEDGITAGVWTAAATIVSLELIAAVRARLELRSIVLQSALGAMLGGLVIALRLVLH